MRAFWNRGEELRLIRRHLKKGVFGYITGRRRVGKSALLREACRRFGGLYHQAVEGTPSQQILHLCEEIHRQIPIFGDIKPKTWDEFLKLLSRAKLPPLIVFDEFPYWVEGDSTLPSLFQKWVDQELPSHKTAVLVSGSSQAMLYSQFLRKSAPLYGRASFHLHLQPMSYRWFCDALRYKVDPPESFVRYALVGGVPHYWKLLPKGNPIQQATKLYFDPSAVLSEEPIALLRDEGVTGTLPKAILDLVGRGVSKPSELASRLGTAQGNLSRPLALLLELGLLHREIPFGESIRSTKKVLYSILDPALSFYYRSYLPNRTRWEKMSPREKSEILRQHASRQWEHFCRRVIPESGRYWEGDKEFDLVAPQRGRKKPLVAECKWSLLSRKEERQILRRLRQKVEKTGLARKFADVSYKVLDQRNLKTLALLEK